jgi:hypothetical protein
VWEYFIGQAVIVVVAVLGYLSTRNKLGQVHDTVNSRLAEQIARAEQLADALHRAGLEVPPPPGQITGH